MAGNVSRTLAGSRGRRGERQALRYLRCRGLTLVARNFRCRLGEIDLIMLRNDTLIFVEVRSRTPSRFASAVESIDGHKQSRLVRTAAIFLRERPEFADYRVRFDVIAIDPAQRSFGKLQWIRDAFRP